MAKLVIGTDKTTGVPAIVKEVAPVEKYPLLSRVKDDSNNDVGTVCGYHTDANNVKYAVVCLNKAYRLNDTEVWISNSSAAVTDLPQYNGMLVFEAAETATFNCDKILAYATAQGYVSRPVNYCRSKSFTIDGTTYYGQLPNVPELVQILMHRTAINTNDPSVSGPEIATNRGYWSSNQSSTAPAIAFAAGAQSSLSGMGGQAKGNFLYFLPILEIPIN